MCRAYVFSLFHFCIFLAMRFFLIFNLKLYLIYSILSLVKEILLNEKFISFHKIVYK